VFSQFIEDDDAFSQFFYDGFVVGNEVGAEGFGVGEEHFLGEGKGAQVDLLVELGDDGFDFFGVVLIEFSFPDEGFHEFEEVAASRFQLFLFPQQGVHFLAMLLVEHCRQPDHAEGNELDVGKFVYGL
jgi:hypothetical protein